MHLPTWARRFVVVKPARFVCGEFVSSRTFDSSPTFDVIAIQFDFEGVAEDRMFESHKVVGRCLEFGCFSCV